MLDFLLYNEIVGTSSCSLCESKWRIWSRQNLLVHLWKMIDQVHNVIVFHVCYVYVGALRKVMHTEVCIELDIAHFPSLMYGFIVQQMIVKHACMAIYRKLVMPTSWIAQSNCRCPQSVDYGVWWYWAFFSCHKTDHLLCGNWRRPYLGLKCLVAETKNLGGLCQFLSCAVQMRFCYIHFWI